MEREVRWKGGKVEREEEEIRMGRRMESRREVGDNDTYKGKRRGRQEEGGQKIESVNSFSISRKGREPETHKKAL